MSVIRKKPFIEDLIEDLSDEQKSDLLDVMNGAGNTVDASFTNMPADAISSVLFKLENNNLKTGILVQSENYNVLLAYHRFQDMQMFKLDTDKFTFEKVNEYLDINELRRVLAGGNGAGEGGSGLGGVALYKHSIPLSLTFDNSGDTDGTLEFLSKYEEPFVENSSLVDLMTYIASLADTECIINPTFKGNDDAAFSLVSNLYPANNSAGIQVCMNGPGMVFSLLAEFSNNTNITDTVTPYLEGGAGGDSVVLYKHTITSNLQSDDGYFIVLISNKKDPYTFGQELADDLTLFNSVLQYVYIEELETIGAIVSAKYSDYEGESITCSYNRAGMESMEFYMFGDVKTDTVEPYIEVGGSTVEAEPIVSIKMTNMDLRPADDSSSTELDNVQLYCTKETWNNMVVYAKQLDNSLDITYSNFGTIYATLSTEIQGALVGFLMMDYLNGKVLPNSYTETPLSVTGSTANIQRFLSFTNTFQGENTNNAKVILGASFGGSGSSSYFPSLDRTSVPYTTSDTVITVEEIAGPAIGASAGSGSSEGTEMQRWTFTFDIANDVFVSVYTKFTQSELSAMLAETNTNIDGINSMMSISLNHINSFDDIGTLIAQSQTIDSTGVLTETLIGTFMSGLCHNEKTISILQDSLFGRRTVVNCYPTVDAQMQIATNYNCVIVNDSNQFATLQINGTYADASYEEI